MTTFEQRIIDCTRQTVEERQKGMDACVSIYPDRIEIDTYITRNVEKSSNGGDYTFWTCIRLDKQVIMAKDCCTCDFWQPQEEWEPYVDMTTQEAIKIVEDVAKAYDVPVYRY